MTSRRMISSLAAAEEAAMMRRTRVVVASTRMMMWRAMRTIRTLKRRWRRGRGRTRGRGRRRGGPFPRRRRGWRRRGGGCGEGEEGQAQQEGQERRDAEQTPEERRKAAQLELLMMGDDADDAVESRRGYDLKALELPKGVSTSDGGGSKGMKGGKRKRMMLAQREAMAKEGGEGPDGFAFDLHDSRFSSVYNSSDYALDPTDPKFRRTAGSESLLAESQNRHKKGGGKAVAEEAVARRVMVAVMCCRGLLGRSRRMRARRRPSKGQKGKKERRL